MLTALSLLLAVTALPALLTVTAPPAFADSDSDSGSDSDSDSDKVDICHVNGSGSIKAKRVNANAVQRHLDHGDFLPLTFYADADGDGYGDAVGAALACEAPAGFTGDGTDCDDSNAAVNPGASEVEGDGIDNDCNPDTPDTILLSCDPNPCQNGGLCYEDAEGYFDECACYVGFSGEFCETYCSTFPDCP